MTLVVRTFIVIGVNFPRLALKGICQKNFKERAERGAVSLRRRVALEVEVRFRIKMHYNEAKVTRRTAFCQKMTDRRLRAASTQLIGFEYRLVPTSAGAGTELGPQNLHSAPSSAEQCCHGNRRGVNAWRTACSCILP